MANFNKTASPKSPVFNNPGNVLVHEAFALALERGLDKVFKREFEALKQGEQFLREEKIDRLVATFQSYRQIGGVIPINRDADDMPALTTGDGFRYTVEVFNYRAMMSYERTLMEIDDVGVIRGRQAEVSRIAALTVEHAIADVFNRGVDDGVMPNGAPVLADDGMYLCDSNRPNANPNAPAWSNLETPSAITPASIFQAQLNARAMTGDDGELYPTYVKVIICRPQDSKTLWEIRNSEYRPTDAMNVTNYFRENRDAHFDIKVYDYLTSANIFYLLADPKSEANELAIYWRVKPQFETWQDKGKNPDVFHQRIRFSFGIGLGSPRKAWRGGVVLPA